MGSKTLRELAADRGLLIGAAVSPDSIDTEPAYRETLAREFNCIVAENCMKFMYVEPEPGCFDFSVADRLVAFAAAQRMKLRGHTLVWHWQLPKWFTEREYTRAEALDAMGRHIDGVARHFRGSVFAWDVVNEGLADDGTWRADSPWFKAIGPDYIEQAFRLAHAADPGAQLVYNDYGMEQSAAKADGCYRMLADFLRRGVPVHAVGFQFHLGLENRMDPVALGANLRRFRELGLDVHITELDMGIKKPITDELRAQQGAEYANRMQIALAAGVTAIVFWGFTDKHSWVPSFTKGEYDEALLFDREYRPKPAYDGVANVLRAR